MHILYQRWPNSTQTRATYLVKESPDGCTYVHVSGSFKIFPDSLYFWEKQNTKKFKVYFIKNSPLVQLYITASDCKGVGNVPESYFVNALSALASQSGLCNWHHESSVTSMLISIEGADINQLQPDQESTGDAPVWSHFYLLRNSWPKAADVLRHCRE
jgi:hypothetical protein